MCIASASSRSRCVRWLPRPSLSAGFAVSAISARPCGYISRRSLILCQLSDVSFDRQARASIRHATTIEPVGMITRFRFSRFDRVSRAPRTASWLIACFTKIHCRTERPSLKPMYRRPSDSCAAIYNIRCRLVLAVERIVDSTDCMARRPCSSSTDCSDATGKASCFSVSSLSTRLRIAGGVEDSLELANLWVSHAPSKQACDSKMSSNAR